MERSFTIHGKATSTLTNYLRCIAHLALHYKCSPALLVEERIDDYPGEVQSARYPVRKVMQSKHSVADVLGLEVDHLHKIAHTSWNARALHAIRKCRTKALGGHLDWCSACNKLHLQFNSCRNRHCPTCQGHKQQQWITARSQELLAVPYFHVVFTLPDTLNPVALHHPQVLYKILFDTVWETLSAFGNNPKHLGAKLGMIAVLHTWGQNLQLHPHLHCIVPKGGVSKAGFWKKGKGKDDFLFSVKGMHPSNYTSGFLWPGSSSSSFWIL